jgi:hypothetical protein
MEDQKRHMSERDKTIKKIEYMEKIKQTRDEMIVPIEIRMLVSLPYCALLFYIFIIGEQSITSRIPHASLLMLLAILVLIVVHNIIRYFLRGVGIVHYLFGMSLVDRETGYLIIREQVWELIKKELLYRLTFTKYKHLFVILEGPYYQSIPMKEMDFVVGYRKQAMMLKHLTQAIKKDMSS